MLANRAVCDSPAMSNEFVHALSGRRAMIGSRWALPLSLVLTCAAALAGSAVPRGQADAEPAAPVPEYEFAEMLTAADAFLASLSAAQRSKALFAFEDTERLSWHFVPRARGGVALK